jgi:hypothetical protein
MTDDPQKLKTEGVTVNTSLDPIYNDAVKNFFSLDHSAFGGNPVNHYSQKLNNVNILSREMSGDMGLNITNGIKGGTGFFSFDASGKVVSTPGTDSIYIDQTRKNKKLRSVDTMTVAIAHEFAHENAAVQKEVEKRLADLQKKNLKLEWTDEFRQTVGSALEHVIIAEKTPKFITDNNLKNVDPGYPTLQKYLGDLDGVLKGKGAKLGDASGAGAAEPLVIPDGRDKTMPPGGSTPPGGGSGQSPVKPPVGGPSGGPGQTPPGSGNGPAPKPVMPPSVTWGPMASPGLPAGGGSKPTAPVQPKLMPNPSSSNRDRQDGPRESGSDRPDDPRFSAGGSGNRNSGGGGSGGGSGGSGGNRSTGPSFEYSGRSGSPSSGNSNSSSAGGWGDMAKAGYGKSTNSSSGSSGQKSSNSGNGPARDTSRTGAARPIILDLGGDGFDVSFTGTARFDMDGDGFRERVGWADAQDALLVLDLNANGSRGAGDGKIDQAKEVVLSLWGDAGMTDMEAVAKARDANGQLMFDTNGDGKLTAADASWREFRVWQDADQDGVTDAGELKTLDQMGFTEIGLTYDDGTSYAETCDDVIIQGAALLGAATRADFGIEWGCQSSNLIGKGNRWLCATTTEYGENRRQFFLMRCVTNFETATVMTKERARI